MILGIFLVGILGAIFWPIEFSRGDQKWIFYDRTGKILFSEKPFLSADLAAQKIPNFLQEVVVVVEGQGFESHFGVNFFSILRAAIQNLERGEIVSGASTIPMQLSRIEFLSGEKRNF